MAWQIGVDVGGTFTDLLALDPERGVFRVAKVLSTPDIDADLPCHPLFLAVLQRFLVAHAHQCSRSCCASGGASFRFIRPS